MWGLEGLLLPIYRISGGHGAFCNKTIKSMPMLVLFFAVSLFLRVRGGESRHLRHGTSNFSSNAS